MKNPLPKYSTILKMIPSKGLLLDAGCGVGNLSRFLLQKKIKIIGCDLEKKTLFEHKDFEYLQRDLDKGLRIDKKFDCIIFADVIEHLKNPKQILEEVEPMTDHLIISIPNMSFFLYRLFPSLENPPYPQTHLHHWKLNQFLHIVPKDWKVNKVRFITDFPELRFFNYIFKNIPLFNQTIVIDLKKINL